MNILSYNVRGLGRGIKWAAIRRLRKMEDPDLICLQETKKELIDKAMCQAIWGDAEVSWEMQPAINSAGGILCMWCDKAFRLQRKVIGTDFIFLQGELIREAQQINIITIYSPCDIHGKRLLWEAVKQLKDLVPAKGLSLTAASTNSMIGFMIWSCSRFLGWTGISLGSDQMVPLGVGWIGAWFPRNG